MVRSETLIHHWLWYLGGRTRVGMVSGTPPVSFALFPMDVVGRHGVLRRVGPRPSWVHGGLEWHEREERELCQGHEKRVESPGRSKGEGHEP